MKFLTSIISFALLIVFASPVVAKKKFTLEEITVQGRLQKPQAFFTIGKKDVKKTKLNNKKRINFLKRSVMSARDL